MYHLMSITTVLNVAAWLDVTHHDEILDNDVSLRFDVRITKTAVSAAGLIGPGPSRTEYETMKPDLDRLCGAIDANIKWVCHQEDPDGSGEWHLVAIDSYLQTREQ